MQEKNICNNQNTFKEWHVFRQTKQNILKIRIVKDNTIFLVQKIFVARIVVDNIYVGDSIFEDNEILLNIDKSQNIQIRQYYMEIPNTGTLYFF